MDAVLKKPIACGIFITRRCDLRCEYCNIPSNATEGELSVEKWKKAMDILNHMGVTTVNILGGEPTLYPGIEKLIEHISHHTNMTASIVTNANDSSKYSIVDAMIESGLSRLSVSVDSLEDQHSISSFKSKSGLGLIEHLEKTGYLRRDGFYVRDYCVINRRNLTQIENLVKYMSNKGIHVYFLPYHWSAEDAYEHRKQANALAIQSDEDHEYLKILCQTLKTMKTDGFLLDNSDEFFDAVPVYIRKLNWHCSRLSEIRIDFNGSMMCCCDRKGSVYEDFSIFQLDDQNTLNRFLAQRQRDSAKCRGCMWSSSFEYEVQSKKRDMKV